MSLESKNFSSIKDAKRASRVLGKVGKYIRRSVKSISVLTNDKFNSEHKFHLLFTTLRCSCTRPSTLSPTSPTRYPSYPATPLHQDQPNGCTIIPYEHALHEHAIHEHSSPIAESENSISTSGFSTNQFSDSNSTIQSPDDVPTVEPCDAFSVSERSKKRWGYVKPNNYLSPYMMYARYSLRKSDPEMIPFTTTPLSLVLLRYRKRQSRRRYGFVAPREGIPKDLPAFEDSFLPYLD